MKKIKLSDSLKNESINFLQDYLKKERKRPFTIRKKREIKRLIQRKEKNLDKFSTEIEKSPLFTLAVAEIIREGHCEKISFNGSQQYDIHPAEIILMMLNIVDKANQQGQKKQLDEYCKRGIKIRYRYKIK